MYYFYLIRFGEKKICYRTHASSEEEANKDVYAFLADFECEGSNDYDELSLVMACHDWFV